MGLNDTKNTDDRRFFMTIEGATQMLDGSGLVVIGEVHGTIKKGDAVNIIAVNGNTVLANIVAIEAEVNGKMAVTDEATDAPANLQIDIAEAEKVAKFSVLTNIEPQAQLDAQTPNENPVVAGLLYTLPKYQKDNQFFSNLTYALTHSHFITPLKFENEPVANADGTETAPKNTRVGFYMLKNPTVDEAEERHFVLPVFTDWTELRKMPKIGDEGKKVRTMMLTFANMVEIIKSPGFCGFVVNPFSKNTMTAGQTLIDAITSVPAYQNEFG